MSATRKLNESGPDRSVHTYAAAEVFNKEPETPLKVSYSLFPRTLECKDTAYTIVPEYIKLNYLANVDQGWLRDSRNYTPYVCSRQA